MQEPLPESSARSAPEAQPSLWDKSIEEYQMLEQIGQGGMSCVFKARSYLLDKELAIKILNPGFQDKEKYLARFANEARSLSQLKHPNIVQIFSFGISKAKRPFLVMEFLGGQTLAEYLSKRGKLSPPEFQEIFRQILEAMSFAHEKQIIHRDLKPENIILLEEAADSGSGKILQVKLLDFGIAKNLSDYSKDQQLSTGLLGTPEHMSPEQCSGAEPDARSDIYSIASIMYQSICGQSPFACESAMKTMYMRMTNSNPTRSPLLRSKEYSPQFLDLILSALQRNPDKRPQTVDEFRDKLALSWQAPGKRGLKIQCGSKALLMIFVALVILPLISLAYFQLQKQKNETQKSAFAASFSQKKNVHQVNQNSLPAVCIQAYKLKYSHKFAEAEALLKAGIHNAKSMNSNESRIDTIYFASTGLADIYDYQNRFDEELNCLDRAEKLFADSPLSHRRVDLIDRQTRILEKLARKDQAIKKIDDFFQETEPLLEDEHSDRYGDLYRRRAELLLSQGELSAAAQSLEHAFNQYDNCKKGRCCQGAVEASMLFYDICLKSGKKAKALVEIEKTMPELLKVENERVRCSFDFADGLVDRKIKLGEAKSVLAQASKFNKLEMDPNQRKLYELHIGQVQEKLDAALAKQSSSKTESKSQAAGSREK